MDLLDPLGEALRAELLGWPGLELRPMMGTLAFFHGKAMLGCYVHRGRFKKTPPKWAPGPEEPPFVWIRLSAVARARALRNPLVKESGTAAVKRWVQVSLGSRAALEQAVRWLGEAYEAARAGRSHQQA